MTLLRMHDPMRFAIHVEEVKRRQLYGYLSFCWFVVRMWVVVGKHESESAKGTKFE